MRVVISSLSIRFYLKDGWTEEILAPYVSGELSLMDHSLTGINQAYLVPASVSTLVNIDGLVNAGLITPACVFGKDSYGELKDLSPIDALKERVDNLEVSWV